MDRTGARLDLRGALSLHRSVDRVEKLPIYAATEVKHVCLVDPDIRTLEEYENCEGKWGTACAYENDDRVSIAPFDAVEIELAALWTD